MGPGDDVFSHFGHAAICVREPGELDGRCYNYGTADFSTPVPLTYEFLRGRAMFWVSVVDRARMLRWYEIEDRSVWVQHLALSPDQARALAARLEASTAEAVKYYRYHHFDDNCTTRIRDAIDATLDGRLRRATDRGAAGPSYRAFVRDGFRGHALLLVVADLLLGRRADRATSAWDAMFLPDHLRGTLSAELGAAPVAVHQRQAPLPRGDPPWLGEALLAVAGLALAAGVALARRRSAKAGGRVLAGVAALLGLLSLIPWAAAVISVFPELVHNEVLLVLLPTDLAVSPLGARWRAAYLRARLVGLLAVAGLMLAGVLVQPLGGALVLVLAPVATGVW